MTKTSTMSDGTSSGTDSEPEIINNDTNNQNGTQRQQIDYVEWFRQKMFEVFENPGLSIKKLAEYIMENGGYKAFDAVAQWLIHHPFSGLIVFVAILLSLPFLIIVGIATSVAFVTFTGFIFLEGTFLTLISILSFGCLGALAIVIMAIVVTFVSVYMGFAYIYDLYGGGQGIALARFLSKENSYKPNTSTNRNSGSISNQQHQPNTESIGPQH